MALFQDYGYSGYKTVDSLLWLFLVALVSKQADSRNCHQKWCWLIIRFFGITQTPVNQTFRKWVGLPPIMIAVLTVIITKQLSLSCMGARLHRQPTHFLKVQL